MRESLKAIFQLFVIGSSVLAAFAWFDDRPDTRTWLFRVGALVAAVGFWVLSRAIYWRKDKARDYLADYGHPYFDRDGFCFNVLAQKDKDVCFITVVFQNRYDRPCVGVVALRQVRDNFSRRKLDTITFEISCAPAAFGIARIPIAVPLKLQGRRIVFEVGALSIYPEGKGRMMRFADATFVRTSPEFDKIFFNAALLAGFAVGKIVWLAPETVKVRLPSDVCEELPKHVKQVGKTLWKLGESPLQ